MACTAHAHPRRTCEQGRQPCPTPYACSGLKTTCGGESVDTELPVTMHERPSMLANRWFWLLGVVCVLAWSGAWWAFVEWLHGRA